MNKIFRIKSNKGMVAVALSEIQGLRVTFSEADPHAVEIVLRGQTIMDAQMSAEEIETLQKAWNEAL